MYTAYGRMADYRFLAAGNAGVAPQGLTHAHRFTRSELVALPCEP